MRPHRTLAAACALGICALGSPARSQNAATAKELLTQGRSEMAAKHYDKGCPALEKSYKLDPVPATLFTLAECENKRGRLATAVARYDEYLALTPRPKKPGAREKTAREQRAALAPQVPQLTLSLPSGAPKGTVVKRDGAALEAAALGSAQSVDPGEHVVTTQAPGGEVTELRVTLGKGEKKQVTLSVKDSVKGGSAAPKPAEAVRPTGQPSHGPSRRRVAIYVTGAVGIAGLVLGGVTGGLAISKKSVLDENCGAISGYPGDPKGCNEFGVKTLNTAKALALTSTIGFAVGAAGVVTAGVLLLIEPKRAAKSSRGVRVEVLSAGREGATLGLQGAW